MHRNVGRARSPTPAPPQPGPLAEGNLRKLTATALREAADNIMAAGAAAHEHSAGAMEGAIPTHTHQRSAAQVPAASRSPPSIPAAQPPRSNWSLPARRQLNDRYDGHADWQPPSHTSWSRIATRARPWHKGNPQQERATGAATRLAATVSAHHVTRGNNAPPCSVDRPNISLTFGMITPRKT